MSCDTSKISLGFELVSRTTADAVLSRLAELENFLQKENIPYSKHHRIARLNGDSLYIPIFIPGSKQFIIDRSFVRYDRKDFRHREEQIIDLSIISSFQEFEHLLQSIKALNDPSQKTLLKINKNRAREGDISSLALRLYVFKITQISFQILSLPLYLPISQCYNYCLQARHPLLFINTFHYEFTSTVMNLHIL